MSVTRWRKRPIVVEAVFFDGSNAEEVEQFAGGPEWFRPVDPEDRGDDPDVIAEVFDKLHSTWVGVKARQWVIRGVKGEVYPCDPEAFTYDPAGDLDAVPAPGDRVRVTVEATVEAWGDEGWSDPDWRAEDGPRFANLSYGGWTLELVHPADAEEGTTVTVEVLGQAEPPCICGGDYSVPDSPVPDERPDCPRHGTTPEAVAYQESRQQPWTGEDPF